MILNELSIQMQNFSKEVVQRKISEFLEICHKLVQAKKDRSFFYTDELLIVPFFDNYTIHDWLKDSSVPKKEKDFFRTLLNRGNILLKSDFLESEFILDIHDNKESAIGCLVAYECDSFVVSFTSQKIWEGNRVSGTYVSLQEENKDVSVKNCTTYEQIAEIEYEEKQQIKLHISSGSDLWDKRGELYPHLIFCEGVKKQLEEARISLQIKNVMQRLQILEDYFKKYKGNFEKESLGYRCRYESNSVQEDEFLKSLRKFKTPYGTEEYFFWHISFPGNYPGRIHFLPDSEHKVGIIGYVGKHLPTKQYPTV